MSSRLRFAGTVLVMALVMAAGLLPAPAAFAQAVTWDTIPTMQLEGLYRGPLRDTVVQRWRDPVDGTVCYLYIPINAQHSAPNETGYVQYGPNVIGSVSCVAGKTAAPVPQAGARPGRAAAARPKPASAKPAPEAALAPALAKPASVEALPEPRPSGSE